MNQLIFLIHIYLNKISKQTRIVKKKEKTLFNQIGLKMKMCH